MTNSGGPSASGEHGTRRWPPPPLGRRLLAATALGCLIVVLAGLLVQSWLDRVSIQPWAAAGLFAGMMAIAAAAMREHHPFPRLGPANQVTMVRGMMLALVMTTMAGPATAPTAWAVGVAAAAFAVLDGFDGWLARRTGMSSPFGARFDMELDAIFILVLSILVWQYEKAGVWVLAAGTMRYAFVAAGRALPWLSRPLRPTRRGRLVAIGVLTALAAALSPLIPTPASGMLAAAAVAALGWSFAIDVAGLWRRRAEGTGLP